MLSEQEINEIEEELAHLPTRESVCIDALKIVQKHRGWVSDEALDDLSPVLGMSVAELDHVATFYNLIFRQPVGEHIILICDSVSCWLTGEETMMSYLQKKTGNRAWGDNWGWQVYVATHGMSWSLRTGSGDDV